MFDFDNFREIWSTIQKNKLRTFLTGFSVAWGIFMLIVMLGAGNGLRNGIFYNFRNFATNSVESWTRYTTKPWKGMQENRRINFKEEDLTDLKIFFPEVSLVSASISHSDTISYNREYLTGETNGVSPDYAQIRYVNVDTKNGRFINEQDMRECRKVIVLSPRMAEVLFRKESPVGKYVRCGDSVFQVVGVYNDDNKSNNAPAYIPFTVAQMLYNKGYGFGYITFAVDGLDTEEANKAFEQRFRAWMARRHQYDPSDENAIGFWSMASEFQMFGNMVNAITLFIWIIGIGTLMAGIVGVSNIMLITVKERTKEFGIRKALGAKPASILGLVITESILVTAVFGYVGMVAGIGVTELINSAMETAQAAQQAGENMGEDLSIFRNPTVDLGIALSANLLIIVAGVLAGYFPARKATHVTAIEAMRAE
ncbi:MAG: ABC transporter permease [bacterium]|nr:ABC transporter permease [bacterium]